MQGSSSEVLLVCNLEVVWVAHSGQRSRVDLKLSVLKEEEWASASTVSRCCFYGFARLLFNLWGLLLEIVHLWH